MTNRTTPLFTMAIRRHGSLDWLPVVQTTGTLLGDGRDRIDVARTMTADEVERTGFDFVRQGYEIEAQRVEDGPGGSQGGPTGGGGGHHPPPDQPPPDELPGATEEPYPEPDAIDELAAEPEVVSAQNS